MTESRRGVGQGPDTAGCHRRDRGGGGIGKSELLTGVRERPVRGIVRWEHGEPAAIRPVRSAGVRTLLARWIRSRSPREQQKLFHGAAASREHRSDLDHPTALRAP